MIKLKCFRENVAGLFMDLWKIVFDLRIPDQNLILKCYGDIEYVESLIEFSAFILDMPLVKTKMNDESNHGLNLYKDFSNQITNLLETCIIDDKKSVFLLIFNLKFGDTIFDKEDPILKQIISIFEDINSLLAGSELYKVFPKQFIKELIFHIKRMDLYSNLNESQLYSVITQRLILNVKFVIVFENSYFYSSTQTKSTSKSIYNIFFKEFPQAFQKFKSKTVEEFMISPPNLKIRLNASFLSKPMIEEVCKINDMGFAFELEVVKLLKTVNKSNSLSNYDEDYFMLLYLFETLKKKMKKKGNEEDMKIISPCLKSMHKKMEDLEKEISELRKYVEERKIETEKVNKNIEEIKLKRNVLMEEINDLSSRSNKLTQNLNGFLNEENIYKKINGNYNESVKTLTNLQIKDYVQEVNFFT